MPAIGAARLGMLPRTVQRALSPSATGVTGLDTLQESALEIEGMLLRRMTVELMPTATGVSREGTSPGCALRGRRS